MLIATMAGWHKALLLLIFKKKNHFPNAFQEIGGGHEIFSCPRGSENTSYASGVLYTEHLNLPRSN